MIISTKYSIMVYALRTQYYFLKCLKIKGWSLGITETFFLEWVWAWLLGKLRSGGPCFLNIKLSNAKTEGNLFPLRLRLITKTIMN